MPKKETYICDHCEKEFTEHDLFSQGGCETNNGKIYCAECRNKVLPKDVPFR